MRTSIRLLITLAVVLLAIAAGAWLWHYYLYTPWTRDGRVAADVVTISPDVSGWIEELAVKDAQQVEKGEVLLTLNTARYEAEVNEAEAEVANRKAQLELKRHEENRRNRLSSQAISKEDREVSRINTRLAQAELAKAQAQLQAARLDLERTTVEAPATGYILNLQLAQGDYVSRGEPVMALVKADSFYVIGYFEETKLTRIHLGDTAHVLLMSGDTRLKGHVSGIARGIADDNQQLDAQLLPQVKPTFNWVRLAQRIPVRITLDDVPEDVLLSAGMSASIRIIGDPDSPQE
ncbi:HlyD family secretion protein [Halomonas sp. M20]|uniref:efflux RND transporter periplasmic adaptor subunit n=1 Tax=Halomonas sp. M20 TaxID=2763264 RepID=UPI001D0BD0EE|nr:HlyD family secretion protein [Halomonas sp. M20]